MLERPTPSPAKEQHRAELSSHSRKRSCPLASLTEDGSPEDREWTAQHEGLHVAGNEISGSARARFGVQGGRGKQTDKHWEGLELASCQSVRTQGTVPEASGAGAPEGQAGRSS